MTEVVYNCIRCFDKGYIGMEKLKGKYWYEFFFACQCSVGQKLVMNPIGKKFANGQDIKTQIRDYRSAVHQGYRFTENFSHVPSYDNFKKPWSSVEQGSKD